MAFFNTVIDFYSRRITFPTARLPRGEQIVGMLNEKPSILERQGIVDRIRVAISEAVEIFKW
jgi:hypothetical protein